MWAAKRKFFIMITFLIIFIGFSFYIYKTFIERTPTCYDGIHNGAEEGIDCGGTCTEVCKTQASKINILWSRTFEVSSKVSNIAALIENPNRNYNVVGVYNIRTFNSRGIRVNDFKKEITLEPGERRIIFIPGIMTGEDKIIKTLVDFTEVKSLTEGEARKMELITTSKIPTIEDGQTRISLGIRNIGLMPKRDIEVITVLYNQKGETINVGKTFIDYIEKRGDKKVNITWPRELDIENMRIEVFFREMFL